MADQGSTLTLELSGGAAVRLNEMLDRNARRKMPAGRLVIELASINPASRHPTGGAVRQSKLYPYSVGCGLAVWDDSTCGLTLELSGGVAVRLNDWLGLCGPSMP